MILRRKQMNQWLTSFFFYKLSFFSFICVEKKKIKKNKTATIIDAGVCIKIPIKILSQMLEFLSFFDSKLISALYHNFSFKKCALYMKEFNMPWKINLCQVLITTIFFFLTCPLKLKQLFLSFIVYEHLLLCFL